ncbi:MAG: hypothetical protein HC925_07455 [Coleofasciculaceae cyanobacterium SM2_3_26]|nr:hypothetical protein [Coleofasciculaceae cyanobacterium SM2_3_26]
MNRRIGFLRGLMSGATCLLMGGSEWFVAASQPPQVATSDVLYTYACQGAPNAPHFLVVAGGGAPGYNEIALEKMYSTSSAP